MTDDTAANPYRQDEPPATDAPPAPEPIRFTIQALTGNVIPIDPDRYVAHIAAVHTLCAALMPLPNGRELVQTLIEMDRLREADAWSAYTAAESHSRDQIAALRAELEQTRAERDELRGRIQEAIMLQSSGFIRH